MIFDSHIHMFPPDLIRARDGVAKKDARFAAIYGKPTSKMATLEDVLAYMNAEKIRGSVVCGFSFKDIGITRHVNDYILESARRFPTINPVTAIGGTRKDALREIERCAASGSKGAGEVAFYERALQSGDARLLDEVASFLESHGMVFVLHMNEQIGHAYAGKANIDFRVVSRFIESHANLTVVLPHLGGGLCFYEFMPEIQKAFKNVFYDTAAIPFLYTPQIYDYLGRFLWHKTLFGSDYPLIPCSRYLKDMTEMDAEKKEHVFWKNAERIFGKKRLG